MNLGGACEIGLEFEPAEPKNKSFQRKRKRERHRTVRLSSLKFFIFSFFKGPSTSHRAQSFASGMKSHVRGGNMNSLPLKYKFLVVFRLRHVAPTSISICILSFSATPFFKSLQFLGFSPFESSSSMGRFPTSETSPGSASMGIFLPSEPSSGSPSMGSFPPSEASFGSPSVGHLTHFEAGSSRHRSPARRSQQCSPARPPPSTPTTPFRHCIIPDVPSQNRIPIMLSPKPPRSMRSPRPFSSKMERNCSNDIHKEQGCSSNEESPPAGKQPNPSLKIIIRWSGKMPTASDNAAEEKAGEDASEFDEEKVKHQVEKNWSDEEYVEDQAEKKWKDEEMVDDQSKKWGDEKRVEGRVEKKWRYEEMVGDQVEKKQEDEEMEEDEADEEWKDEEMVEDQPEEQKDEKMIDDRVEKKWNLRPRKPIGKARAGAGNVPQLQGGSSSQKAPQKKPAVKKKKPMKLSIALTKKEIEEDLLAMTGSRPSKKPKRRPKALERILNVR